MGQVVMQGSLTVNQSTAGVFPTATFNDVLQFAQANPRNYVAAVGMITRAISSPNAYVALGGIGAASDVTTADFLYLASNGPIDVRLTLQVPGSGTTTSVISVSGGPLVLPVSAGKLIVLVEVQGSATICYFASGPA